MTPEIQKALAEFINSTMVALKTGGAFVAEQLPLVLQEKIIYGRVTETATFILFTLIAIGLAIGAKKAFAAFNDAPRFEGEATLAILIACGLGTLMSGFTATAAFDDMAKVWFAPRLYLLEWAAGLIKNG